MSKKFASWSIRLLDPPTPRYRTDGYRCRTSEHARPRIAAMWALEAEALLAMHLSRTSGVVTIRLQEWGRKLDQEHSDLQVLFLLSRSKV
jgi:hypothetical protein